MPCNAVPDESQSAGQHVFNLELRHAARSTLQFEEIQFEETLCQRKQMSGDRARK
jgi:hypothetical protein